MYAYPTLQYVAVVLLLASCSPHGNEEGMRVHVIAHWQSPSVFAAERCHSRKPTAQPEHELAVYMRQILKLGEVRLQELPKQRVLSPGLGVFAKKGSVATCRRYSYKVKTLGDTRPGTGGLE
jgi:hypothetical protein